MSQVAITREAPPHPTDSDREAVINSIRQIVHALQVGSRAAQKSLGLSAAQLFVLQILASGEWMSINEIAAKSHTHQSSVSVVVTRLVQAKLVKRVQSADDARRAQLTVTAAGKQVLEEGFVTPQQRLFDSLRALPPERLADLRSLLQEVVFRSGMDSAVPPMFFEPDNKTQSTTSSPDANTRNAPSGTIRNNE